MGLQCGIIGLPNVGKSTLFNCLTNANIAAENYPFCTIEPNLGLVPVPDPRLDALARIIMPNAIMPTTVEFVDIAGLVAGASQGAGLGNKFLAHIRATDAIIHVVRCFADDNILHVDSAVVPSNDIATINTELALADIATIDNQLRKASGAHKLPEQLRQLLEFLRAQLNQGEAVRSLGLDANELALLAHLNLLTAKPILYLANCADTSTTNSFLQEVMEIAHAERAELVPIAVLLEAELQALPQEERLEFLRSLGYEEPGLDRVIRAAYALLGLSTYFTAGKKEVRAWTIKQGSNAVQAAGVIHSDFSKNFIRAEVIAYEDFIRYAGEAGAKAAGKWRLEGKDYLVQDGDVLLFRCS